MLPALIFDLDGLLSDTETLHMQADISAFAHFSFTLTEAEFTEHWIRQGLGIEQMIEKHQIQTPAHIIRQHKFSIYQSLLDTQLKPMPGTQTILAHFHGKTPMALATGSFRADAEKVLHNLGITQYFSSIITGSEVKRGKPAPDIFLQAAASMGVAPKDCIVLEDAEKGIIAAHRAGMRSIAIPNQHTILNDFSLATHRCASLIEAIDLIGTLAA